LVAGFAFAACEVEVRVEWAFVRLDLRADEHQAVRLEERAEIAVGEQPRMRGVAGALEAVELERDERVDRRELIDHEQAAAAARHARHLGEHELGAVDVVQHCTLADEVERLSREAEVRDVALDELHVRVVLARVLATEFEQLGDEIDADDVANVRRERERERTRAGADVEHDLVAARLDELRNALGQPGQAPQGRLGDALRIRAEARANGILVHESTTVRRARSGLDSIRDASS
jgi:hypothetical protein